MRLYLDISIGGQAIKLHALHLKNVDCQNALELAKEAGISFEMTALKHQISMDVDPEVQKLVNTLVPSEWASLLYEARRANIEILSTPSHFVSTLKDLSEWAGNAISVLNIKQDIELYISAFSLNTKGDLSFNFEVKSNNEGHDLFEVSSLGLGLRVYHGRFDATTIFKNITCSEERAVQSDEENTFIKNIIKKLSSSNN